MFHCGAASEVGVRQIQRQAAMSINANFPDKTGSAAPTDRRLTRRFTPYALAPRSLLNAPIKGDERAQSSEYRSAIWSRSLDAQRDAQIFD